MAKHRIQAFRQAMALLLLAGTPVAAEVWEYGQTECNELWFMRNLIVDRAGYCF